MANDQKVYDMTGCLSKCEKYVYNAEAEDSMLAQEAVFPEHNNTLAILLMLVTGEYEERRQVYCPCVRLSMHIGSNICNFSTLCMTMIPS